MTTKLKLNLGAGQNFIPGFVNIDISEKAELTLDLGKDRLPFEDDSVELIFSYHTLEHVPDYLFALSEIHRVLRHGGIFLVGLPYVTLTEFNLVNPYHLHHFNEFSFSFFDRSRLKGSAAEQNVVAFQEIYHRHHYIGGFHLVPPPLKSWCRRHLFNVVRKIDFGLLAVKPGGGPIQPILKDELQNEFRRCLESRIRYGKSAPPKGVGMGKKVADWWSGNDF